MSDIEREAQFLIGRLREFENENMDESAFRDWSGHVCPSIARLEGLLKSARQAPASGEVEPVAWDDPAVDPIVSKLYRKFKDWSQRGFTADDVTWCEVRGYVAELMNAHPPAKVPEGLTEKALELCRAVENEEEFPPAKFALRCLMLVNQIRKLAATPTPATTPEAERHEWNDVGERKKPLAVRRSKISAGNYKVTRQDGEVFIIQKGVVAKGWTIENQRTLALDSAVDLGQANYMITNCIGKVCAESVYSGTATIQAEAWWFSLYDRAPHDSDADPFGDIYLCIGDGVVKTTPREVRELIMVQGFPGKTYWMPTGVKRPTPPQEQ